MLLVKESNVIGSPSSNLGTSLYKTTQGRPTPEISRQKLIDLLKETWEVLSHPPYSPDITPSDFHLFRSLSNALADKKSQNKEQVYNFLHKFFYEKEGSFYSRGIKPLKER